MFDREMLSRTLAAQYQVISREQALKCVLRRSTVTTWCKPNKKWQKLLPGVYLAVTGTPTSEQRLVAAMLYAGKRSVITGSAALRLHRLRPRGPDLAAEARYFPAQHRPRSGPERLGQRLLGNPVITRS